MKNKFQHSSKTFEKQNAGSFLNQTAEGTFMSHSIVNQLVQKEKKAGMFLSPKKTVIRGYKSPCKLNISCTSTTAESRAKIWYQ